MCMCVCKEYNIDEMLTFFYISTLLLNPTPKNKRHQRENGFD